jgi:hypothetical protein
MTCNPEESSALGVDTVARETYDVNLEDYH